MVSRLRVRAALDLTSGLLGLLAGVVLVADGTIGLPEVPGVATRVTVMGLLGAGFSAVGVGHVTIDDRARGFGEFAAGLGVILVGLSFGIQPGTPLFVLGAVALFGGGVVLVADSFGADLADQF